MSKIAEDLGRLFEVGFNIGVLTYIKQQNIKHFFGDLYRQELQQLNFAKMRQRIIDKVISTLEREISQTWSTFFLQKGFLSGLNFFQEYLTSTGWHEEHRLKHVEILYYHCRFSGDNSVGTYDVEDDKQWYARVLSQLQGVNDFSDYINNYKKKGEFLNADSLILLRYRKEYRMLCVDLSIFSIRSEVDIQNIDYVEIIRYLLKRDISYFRSKSVFSRLRIDSKSLDFHFSDDLKSYFSAFKYKDKESAKLIQAAGYAYSFYQFLQETKILPEILSGNTPLTFNAVGYSDRAINTMSLGCSNLDILKTCYEIYKYDSSEKEITSARSQVLNRIKRSAYASFERGKSFIDSLLEISPNQLNCIPPHQEKITGFFNSVGEVPPDIIKQLGLTGVMNLRQAHAALINKALISQDLCIFLTGNPGIGKTTAIVNFLKKHINDGFLFFYVSPRKQVNLDIIEKFKNPDKQLCDDRIIAINSHSNLINDNSGRFTVQYTSNKSQDKFPKKSVDFIDSRNIERHNRRADKLKRKTDDEIGYVGNKSRGVLHSVCEALAILIEQDISNQIVATASIQSLKKTEGGNTLRHFEKIFRSAYNEREGNIFPEKLQQISSRIKHLYIMIDEITGDDGGVEFLNGIHDIIIRYKLNDPKMGFNTKIIVADASIVDKDVINQHLSDTTSEPDKIYFRRASENCNQPISIEALTFKRLPATVINTNSYPAKSLSITYKIILQTEKFNEQTLLKSKDSADSQLQTEILKDIEALLERSDVEQFIVYIQNKRKLAEFIEKIKKSSISFAKYTDYIEVHADISEEEKLKLQEVKNQVKVVFMTASGSRGLSFPKVKHILVEIPKFQIEQNLMEIIQVIYRGRGDDNIDNQDKELTFYLSERSIYYQDSEDRQTSIQESVLSVLNILLILKAAIMTRIFGSGHIGRERYIIIPIGGKAVFAAGENFSAQMANLIGHLKNESYRDRSNPLPEKVYKSLEQLLGNAEFMVRDTGESNYLKLRESFNHEFYQNYNTLDKLLDFAKIEQGYISGGMLIVPIPNNTLEERYLMQLAEISNIANDELWRDMQTISHSKSYPENLRSAMKDAIELIKNLREGVDISQYLELQSKRFDQYYALPLFAFISSEVMREYFALQPEEPEDSRFRDILASYIRSLYPVGNILPIGSNYREFPFVVFRSYSLVEIRQKIFTDKYLLASNELNVLNLILTKE